MRYLGIDPGTTRVGYGLIEGCHTPKLLSYGVIEIKSVGESDRLLELARAFEKLIESSNPAIAGVERIFFAKNRKTAISVAQARGVIVSKLAEKNIRMVEWHPSEVKRSVTNYGGADKRAVSKMGGKILGGSTFTGHDDATDALAIAIATAFHYGTS